MGETDSCVGEKVGYGSSSARVGPASLLPVHFGELDGPSFLRAYIHSEVSKLRTRVRSRDRMRRQQAYEIEDSSDTLRFGR